MSSSVLFPVRKLDSLPLEFMVRVAQELNIPFSQIRMALLGRAAIHHERRGYGGLIVGAVPSPLRPSRFLDAAVKKIMGAVAAGTSEREHAVAHVVNFSH
jgi:hypothetical protein